MPYDDTYDQSAILNLLADDSQYAFQLIFDRFKDRVYKLAILYLKSPVLAEEVVQDTFCKLWFQRANIQDVRSLEAWLHTVSKNLTLNCLRKLARESDLRQKMLYNPSGLELGADLHLRQLEFTRLHHEAVDLLSTQQKTIYLLAREQGLSYEAISRQLQISPLTVKTHMNRALSAIRQFLARHGHTFIFLFLLLPLPEKF